MSIHHIPINKDLATNCLQNDITNPKSCDLLKDYETVLNLFVGEGVIEKVKENKKLNDKVHYLPNGTGIMPTSSNKIGPVFDC